MRGHWRWWWQPAVSKFPLSRRKKEKRCRINRWTDRGWVYGLKIPKEFFFFFNPVDYFSVVVVVREDVVKSAVFRWSFTCCSVHLYTSASQPPPRCTMYCTKITFFFLSFFLPPTPYAPTFAIMWINSVEMPLTWSGSNHPGKFCISFSFYNFFFCSNQTSELDSV